MAEDLNILQGLNREDTYLEIIPQIEALITSETDLIANLANISAMPGVIPQPGSRSASSPLRIASTKAGIVKLSVESTQPARFSLILGSRQR